MKVAVYLAAHAAALLYPVSPTVLERIAWRESRFVATAQHGTCCGLMQTESRFSRYTCAQLKLPLVSMLEGARLLVWARRHCHNDGTHWYATGRCK